MRTIRTSLCRFPRRTHHKSWQWSPASADRNFMPETAAAIFALCRGTGLSRNDVASALPSISSYSSLGRNAPVPGQYHAIRAILSTVLAVVLLCTAFAFGKAQAGPSAAAIARGKAPVSYTHLTLPTNREV